MEARLCDFCGDDIQRDLFSDEIPRIATEHWAMRDDN